MIGKSLGHYEITDLLGKGGMGEVYRARDTRLKRDVALKVLSDHAADPERLARLQREAEALAGLNHPHIVHVYSVEAADDIHFLTMELVEGRRLDADLLPGGMPLAQVLEIGSAVADALAWAHEHGIIHRDLKPANIMVTRDGRVKVLDFGLAKHAPYGDPAGAADTADTQTLELTRDGAAVGTVPYMSPEQVRGQTVDHRSDIFSFGILVYELAAGQRPFAGASGPDITSATLRDTPPMLEDIRSDLPHHLGRIVARCLEKEPAKRYQSAKDIHNDLEGLRDEIRAGSSSRITTAPPSTARGDIPRRGRSRWLALAGTIVLLAALAYGLGRGGKGTPDAPAFAPDAKSVAVLAFVNMSDDPTQEYFSDGISEELLNLLARIPELKVISRSSAFSFKGRNLKLSTIARELNVSHILEGSVRKDGDRVRITAQLIDARSDAHLWSETYDRTLGDIFAIQDEIAAEVVARMRLTLLKEAPKVVTTDPAAYALYLQARYLGNLFTAEGWQQSDDLYQQALAIDPDYAPAWDGLSGNYTNEANKGLRPVTEGFQLAREAAYNALAIAPDYAPAHDSLGWIALFRDDDLTAAAHHYERALALDPADPRILGNAASLLTTLGRLDEAIGLQESGVVRDPVNAAGFYNLGLNYLLAGRWDEAISAARTTLRLSPEYIGARYLIGTAQLYQNLPETALEEFALEVGDEESQVKGAALALYDLGRQAEYEAKLAELIRRWGEQWPSEIAHVYAYTNQADEAFGWLDKSLTQGEFGFNYQLLNQFYGSIHNDPRWALLLERAGVAPEQLAAIRFVVPPPG
ncbi:MAG: protein kinase [Candidatus Krumholzibacteria bacterium]|nr:protein kinase [Candidatus Krumholzibacteria bacterium]